jgi:hypothetical protein
MKSDATGSRRIAALGSGAAAALYAALFCLSGRDPDAYSRVLQEDEGLE